MSRAFLEGWHARHPGATARVFSDFRGSDGRSSYQWLRDDLLESVPQVVLDLACGDGYLSQLVLDAAPGSVAIEGLDLSRHELALARRRLGDRVGLRQGDAAAMPFENETFDVIGCHMAVMLMAPIEPVIGEILRVLRPGGVFSAVVGARVRNEPYATFIDRLIAVERDENVTPPSFGDRRFLGEAGVFEMFSAHPLCGVVSVSDRVVGFRGSPLDAWGRVHLMYNVDPLSQHGQSRLRDDTLAAWAPAALADGEVRLELGMRLIRVSRR